VICMQRLLKVKKAPEKQSMRDAIEHLFAR